MITNYYNASNNFSAPIRKEPRPYKPQQIMPEHHFVPAIREQIECEKKPQFLNKIDQDTLLLAGLLLLLFFSGCDDMLLLLALCYLLLF